MNITDALGRLTQVKEDPSNLNYGTQYTWGADDTLQTVVQGSQTRTFGYDSLQHLISAANPESQSGVGTYYPSRDALGRPLQSQVQINGQTYSFSYVYDLSGALTSETYPSGRVIKTSYDGAERANAVSGTLGTQQSNYVGSVQYWPHGAPYYYQYGNNVWPVNTFDSVLRPNQTYSTVGNNPNYWLLYIINAWNTNSTLGSLSEGYGPAVTWSNMTWYAGSFGYDNVNRLTTATDTGWNRAFSYDQYANMSVTSSSNVPTNGLTPVNRFAYTPFTSPVTRPSGRFAMPFAPANNPPLARPQATWRPSPET